MARLRPRDVVGVPVLPPARVTAIADRMRSLVGTAYRRMAPPPVQVLEGLFGILDHAALGALCRLDVPDALDAPMTVDELAVRVDVDADVLGRLVAYATARGWLGRDRRGRVRPTATSRFLRRDHPGGWRAWVDFATGAEVVAALSQLATEPGTADPFAAANGASFFDWYPQHPDRHAAFDAAMAAGGRMHGLALSSAIDWSGSTAVCDVGGGTGALLRVLLDAQLHLQGVLFDLPEVAARTATHERLRIVGGDAFAGLPDGCDTYLFVNVLHDWDDERTVALLSSARAAAAAGAGSGARVIVVESERRERPVDGMPVRTDLLMLALAPGGRERSAAEFESLGRRAGLAWRQSVRLASGDVAHVMGV